MWMNMTTTLQVHSTRASPVNSWVQGSQKDQVSASIPALECSQLKQFPLKTTVKTSMISWFKKHSIWVRKLAKIALTASRRWLSENSQAVILQLRSSPTRRNLMMKKVRADKAVSSSWRKLTTIRVQTQIRLASAKLQEPQVWLAFKKGTIWARVATKKPEVRGMRLLRTMHTLMTSKNNLSARLTHLPKRAWVSQAVSRHCLRLTHRSWEVLALKGRIILSLNFQEKVSLKVPWTLTKRRAASSTIQAKWTLGKVVRYPSTSTLTQRASMEPTKMRIKAPSQGHPTKTTIILVTQWCRRISQFPSQASLLARASLERQ